MSSEKKVMLQLCRLCQHNIGTNVISEDPNLSIIIKRVTKVEVNDVLKKHMPNSICTTCSNILIDTCKFIERAQQVDKTLRSVIEEKLQTSERESRDDHQQSEPFICCICNKQFGKEISYNIHRRSHLEIYCNLCRCSFKHTSEKNKHVCINFDKAVSVEVINKCEIVNDRTLMEKPREKFPCQIKDCTEVFSSRSARNNHKLYHDGKKPFLCVTCGKCFHTRNSLNCHENIHRERKLYKCLECNLAFSTRSNLQAHLKKYHEGVRFCCSQCPKQFLGRDSLHRHEKIHIGIKEFQCQKCTSAFYTSKELVKHQRYHQGLRQYKCEQCFRPFFERHHLTVHLRSHTGERPFICNFPGCGKSFADRQKMKRHHKALHMKNI